MSLVKTLSCNHLLHWLHFIAYESSCVLSNVAIDDDSVVVVVVVVATIACVIRVVETHVNPTVYGVKGKLFQGGRGQKWGMVS